MSKSFPRAACALKVLYQSTNCGVNARHGGHQCAEKYSPITRPSPAIVLVSTLPLWLMTVSPSRSAMPCIVQQLLGTTASKLEEIYRLFAAINKHLTHVNSSASFTARNTSLPVILVNAAELFLAWSIRWRQELPKLIIFCCDVHDVAPLSYRRALASGKTQKGVWKYAPSIICQ